MKTDVLIFDVGLGQSVFVYPHSNPEHGMLIDCGNTEDFDPVDFLLERNLIPNKILGNLVLTNYDQDHFSGLPSLREKVGIYSVNFSKNLSSEEIKSLKEQPHTEALKKTCEMKDEYCSPIENYNPPYTKKIFHLNKEDLEQYDTNNLSQVVFVEHLGTVVCISGDMEENGWKILLQKNPDIKNWLAKTNIFIASHHGRDNGYCCDLFSHCSPECIVISDKGIIHDTQKNMSSLYAGHVRGQGVLFNGGLLNRRKVLTTRDDGHLWIQLSDGRG